MDPLTTGAIAGLALVSEKLAEKVLEKLVGDGVDKTWTGREKLAEIFRKYAYGELQTLQLTEKYAPDKKTIRGEIDKLSDFLRRNEEALREIAALIGESLTPNFGEFNRYRELENYHKKLKEKLKEKFAGETDELKRLRISAETETVSDEIEQLKKTILDFAETITRIPNPSEKQKKARELFFAGNFDDARILFEDSREEMQSIKTRALAAKDSNEAERTKIEEKLEELANDYLLLAQSTAANFSNPDRLEDTRRYFNESIECLASVDNIFPYARFLQDHNQHQSATALYQRIRDEFRGEISEENYAATLNNLGLLHQNTQEFRVSENEYIEALAIYRRLAEANPATFEPYVALTLNNLGILHYYTQEYTAAKSSYEEALTIMRRLAIANPAAYEPDLIMTINNLASLHQITQEHASAESEYKEALTIGRRLAEVNPVIGEPYMAAMLHNLATLHQNKQEFTMAEREFDEALTIRRGLAEANPTAYEPDVAMTLNNLGILHQYAQDFVSAEREYEEALAIRRRLTEANPPAYESDLAVTLNNLGSLHNHMQKFAAAESEYWEALAIKRRLAAVNPATYEPDVAMTLNNLGNLHQSTREFAIAEKEYEEALTIRRRLAEENPAAHKLDVASTLNNLGNLHKGTQKFAAEREYDEALAIYRLLAEANQAVYEPYVALTLVNMAIFFLQNKPDRERSIELAQEAVKIITPYIERAPYTRKYLEDAVAVLKAWEEEV